MVEYWVFLPDHKMLGIVKVFHNQFTGRVASSSSLRLPPFPFRQICKNMFLDSKRSCTCKDYYILDRKYI